MKLREQLDTLRTLERLHRGALQYMVLGRVTWTEQKMVSRYPDSERRMLRVGMVDCSEPFVIVHFIDSHEVVVQPAHEVSTSWCWPAVDAFPSLVKYLRHAEERAKLAEAHKYGNKGKR